MRVPRDEKVSRVESGRVKGRPLEAMVRSRYRRLGPMGESRTASGKLERSRCRGKRETSDSYSEFGHVLCAEFSMSSEVGRRDGGINS